MPKNNVQKTEKDKNKNVHHSKKRAINGGPESVVAQERRMVYAKVYEKIKEANQQGYYLEAITLCESIIADRLEARIAYLTHQQNRSFKTLGQCLKSINKLAQEGDENLVLLCREVRTWSKKRNAALHEMAKLSENNFLLWEERYKQNKEIAAQGERLSRKISNEVRKANKRGIKNKPL